MDKRMLKRYFEPYNYKLVQVTLMGIEVFQNRLQHLVAGWKVGSVREVNAGVVGAELRIRQVLLGKFN